LAISALLALSSVIVSDQSAGASTTPKTIPMHILSGPVVSKGRLILITINSSKHLDLTAVNPSTNAVAWQMPFSASVITLGQPFEPVAVDGVAIDLYPKGAKNAAQVSIRGIDVATGKLVWTSSVHGVVSDAPVSCNRDTAVCFSWAQNDTSATARTGLVELSIKTGATIRTLSGSQRELGTSVYQADSSSSRIFGLGPNGKIEWRDTTASIFTPVADDSNNGWNLDRLGNVEVGSLGLSNEPSTIDLSRFTTAGINATTGLLLWRQPGMYNCMGAVEFLSAPVLCKWSGTVVKPTTETGKPSFKHVTLTLEGFNSRTGDISWSRRVLDYTAFADSEQSVIPFLDGTHLPVTLANGSLVDLNTATGATSAVGTVFWCATYPVEGVIAPPNTSSEPNLRIGAYQFSGCDANAKPATTWPTSTPSAVGVTTQGRFYWPTAKGLTYRSTTES
jgi:hypothetical protein